MMSSLPAPLFVNQWIELLFGKPWALFKANNAKLAAVFIALNRKEKGKGELSAIQEVERDYQCQVLSIIDFDDLMQFIENEANYQQYLPAMRAYRESYGV